MTSTGLHACRNGAESTWPTSAKCSCKLLARVEAGFSVEIARNGVPVARLVPIDADDGPGRRFLAAHVVL